MITAESLYKISNISPADFGPEIVDPDLTVPEQRQAAIDHIEEEILPGAESEVSVPLLKASGGNGLPFSNLLISRKYPALKEQSSFDGINDNLNTLFETAVKSYAKAEINKEVATNGKTYDEDADDDRKIAGEKLQKLLDAVEDIMMGPPEGTEKIGGNKYPNTQSVKNTFVF